MKLGSLCTGYGGLDMAVEAYFNAETVWVSEIDKPASQLIKTRINKPNLGNLKVIDWANVEPIDIITAGLLRIATIAWTIVTHNLWITHLTRPKVRLSYPHP